MRTRPTLNPLAQLLALSLLLSAAPTSFAAEEEADAIDAAIASDIRTDAERSRDNNRKPKETLAFFGFENDMRVVEIFPGGGWYTKILAPLLKDKGEYYAAGGLGKALGFGEILGRVRDVPGLEEINIIDLSGSLTPGPQRGILNAESLDFGVRRVDLVLTFRNLHNLSPDARAAMYKAAHKALKRGGKFGVIDHTRRHMQADEPEIWRRLDPVLVIKEAQAHGFTLADYSTLHYRPDDELRYEVGRRSVAGNTDRFTLLFTK